MPAKSTAGNPTAVAIAKAARAIFEDEGATGVSMRRVADAVGITPMAIYRHYANREALLHRVADDAFEELAGHAKPRRRGASVEDHLLDLLEAYLDYALAHPRIFDYAFSEPRPDARRYPTDFRAGRSPTANLIAQAVREGIAAKRLRDGDAWEIALALWAHSHGLICLWRGGRFDLSARQFRALHRNSLGKLLDGLRL